MLFEDKNIVAAPIVSVIMPTYNHSRFIAQAIDSVLSQKTNFPIELIIGEDCSTDNTRQICLDYQQKHPTIIRLFLPEENVGFLRNYGQLLKLCRGKYIAIGTGAVILGGITIGENAMIGAGSVVTKDVPDGELWYGNPAMFVKKI